MNKITRYVAAICIGAVAFGCEDEENKDDSTLIKSNPTVAIDIPNPTVSFMEKDSTFQFAITLSTPQIVDVAINIKAIEGSATEGEDFSVEGGVIPAGETSGSVKVKVSADAVPEGTETFTIQIGDDQTTNATIAPKTVTFTIMNVSEGDLPLSFSWSSIYYDATGELVPAVDVANMIFYITDLNGVVVKTINGTGFESFVMEESFANGTYLLKAGIVSAIDPGDLGDAPILDLSIAYSQVGKLSPVTLSFPKAFDTKLVCSGNLFTLAKVVKAGSDYTVTIVSEAASVDVVALLGAYDCLEPGYKTYPVNFTEGTLAGEIVNDNFWDSGASVKYVLDVCGTVTIPRQSILAGAYTVTGSGTYDPTTQEMVVDYVVKTAAGATADTNTHTFTRP